MISFDAASNSGYQAASGSYSWSHTCGGSYRCLVVSVALLNVANEVSALTYNGVALTKLRSDVDGTGTIRTDIYYLVNPALGTNTISITLNSASVSGSSAASYSGVDPDNPVDAQAGTTGTTGAGGGSSSLSVTTVSTGAMIVDAIATTDTSIAAASGQNSRSNITGAVGSGGQSDKQLSMAPSSTTMAWDNIGALLNWTASAIALKPFNFGTTTSTTSVSTSSTSMSSTSSSISTTSSSTSSTSKSTSTSSTSYSMSITTLSTSSTSSSISSTSSSSTSSSTSVSSTSSSISSTSMSSTSQSSTSSSTSMSSTSSSFSSTSSSMSSTSASTSSTSFSSTSSSSSTSTTAIPANLIYSYEDRAATTVTQQFIQTGTWVCPANVTSVQAECWGAGGGGGGDATTNAGGGGGGGQYAKANTLAVTPGTSYTVTVGTGGSAGVAGGDSWFSSSATVLAKGGAGGAGSSVGAAAGGSGSVAGSIGDVKFNGGDGGSSSSGVDAGGGGGGGAGSNATGRAGANGVTGTGGAGGGRASIYGGAGGVGASGTVASGTGTALGGGGGGGSGPGLFAPSVGINGMVQLTYTTTGVPTTSSSVANSFTAPQVGDVDVSDGDYFIEYGSEYMIQEYKRQNLNNTDTPKFTWSGRSTYDTRVSPLLIQIYNVNSAAWETLATTNNTPADTDFTVKVSQSANVANYYDSANTVVFRVYQQVI